MCVFFFFGKVCLPWFVVAVVEVVAILDEEITLLVEVDMRKIWSRALIGLRRVLILCVFDVGNVEELVYGLVVVDGYKRFRVGRLLL